MFEFTVEGCEKATLWLKQNNLFYLVNKELSCDGYTIVNLANSLKKKYESKHRVL